MKVTIKPDKGFGKITFELDDYIANEILKLGEEFKVPIERILQIIIFSEFKKPSSSNIEKAEEEIKKLEKKVWNLEMEFAPLKFKAYNVTQENKLLAIEVSGLLAENVQLKRFLKMKIDRNVELRKIISYYMGV
ncbi:hypothetical protein [Pyrococcus horikoshii]|uniref:Uncharacterized protein n=2 Tax=Pyrococcus horikoshii TaxID=53953 RepID=O58438_PYRHO|nr:hypothetical protein [Pyrococcus horikoshii]BAA29798.1 133aa long hypothetical protein [Pyrococcus horikoshii OT3]HII61362.1 hypothetical protein [Pyrococcus horikoshii]